jgi:hypothetical protein
MENNIFSSTRKPLLPDDQKLWRYERKFLVNGLSSHQMESVIKRNTFMFSPVYEQRWVNNIYLDTTEKSSYADNVEGLSNREKYRIRWYGNLFGNIEKPVFEIKIKRGLLGKKETFKLPAFDLDESFGIQTITTIIDSATTNSSWNIYLKSMGVSLINRYCRRYYMSSDKKFRITLDMNLMYQRVHQHGNYFLSQIKQHQCLILELKYAEEDNQQSQFISNQFPFRMTKSSKYIMGTDLLG